MTESVSNFPCTKCKHKHMRFIDNQKFVCPNCGWEWKLTELGERLVGSIDLK